MAIFYFIILLNLTGGFMGLFTRKKPKTEIESQTELAQKNLESLISYNKELDIAKAEVTVQLSSANIRLNGIEFQIKTHQEDARKFAQQNDDKSARNMLYRIKTYKEQLSSIQSMVDEYSSKIKQLDVLIEKTQRQRFETESILENLHFAETLEKDATIKGDDSAFQKLLTRNGNDLRSVQETTEKLKIRAQARAEANKMVSKMNSDEDDIFSDYQTEPYGEDAEVEEMLAELKAKK